MFEKEAEEYVKHWIVGEDDNALMQEAYKDGAEFGYNKAKVEVEESYRESLCNSELNLASVTERLEELNKANEWHYISEKGFPKDEKAYFVIINYGALGNECGVMENLNKDKPKNVIAWKEIVLPKENK